MKPLQKRRDWRIGYAIFCLFYVVWVIYLSLNNFDMVHTRYRLAEERLQPEQIGEIARQELVEKCRKEAKRNDRLRPPEDEVSPAPAEDCLSWPAAVLEEQQKVVKERLVVEKSRTARKLVLFYVSFLVIFLLLPLIVLYLLLAFFIWIFKSRRVDT